MRLQISWGDEGMNSGFRVIARKSEVTNASCVSKRIEQLDRI